MYWHTCDPDVLFYVDGKDLIRYHVGAGTKEVVTTFDFCSGGASAGSDPLFMPWASNRVGLTCDEQVFIYHWAEPHTVPSPGGTRAVFGSDWGNGDTVDTYVIEPPSTSRDDRPRRTARARSMPHLWTRPVAPAGRPTGGGGRHCGAPRPAHARHRLTC
ncbi:hypothetical protein [Sorangium sp. So ce341]|uniref:hypothetical protein n=1 Tax=Sorangium sp. So ce341 TaxID=3133302 RepID=UPI003F62EAA3